LYAAAASFLDARAHGGRWLLRIEDLDRPREVAGATAAILRTLEKFGFEWDGPVVRQFERIRHYEAALSDLSGRDLTFSCSCSRLQLEDELRYPGTCRRGASAGVPCAVRLRVDPGYIAFRDRVQGVFRQEVSSAVGDFVLKRRDQLFAYVLAVVVDDAAQEVTHVVRGADLLDNTPRQVYLQRLLGLPEPTYAHVPVLTEADGAKLAKSRRSVRLSADAPLPQLVAVFSMLGLEPPSGLRTAAVHEAWGWARARWDVGRVPRRLHLCVND
jgi:glutamyl-Q tRNA(Asp) synthetase